MEAVLSRRSGASIERGTRAPLAMTPSRTVSARVGTAFDVARRTPCIAATGVVRHGAAARLSSVGRLCSAVDVERLRSCMLAWAGLSGGGPACTNGLGQPGPSCHNSNFHPYVRSQRTAAVAGALRVSSASRSKDLLRLVFSAMRAATRTRAMPGEQRQLGTVMSAHLLDIACRSRDHSRLLRHCLLDWRHCCCTQAEVDVKQLTRQMGELERWGQERQAEVAALQQRSLRAEEAAREAELELSRRSCDEFERLRSLEEELRELQAEVGATSEAQLPNGFVPVDPGGSNGDDFATPGVHPPGKPPERMHITVLSPRMASAWPALRHAFAAWSAVTQHRWLLQSLLEETALSERQAQCFRALIAWRATCGKKRLLVMAAQSLSHQHGVPGRGLGFGNSMCRALARIVLRIWSASIAVETSSAGLSKTPTPARRAVDDELSSLASSFVTPSPAPAARTMPLLGTPRRVWIAGGASSDSGTAGTDDGYLAPHPCP